MPGVLALQKTRKISYPSPTIFERTHISRVSMPWEGHLGHEQDFLDSLAVMEEGMRHFYVRAITAKQTKQPDKVIDAAMIQAVQIAESVR
jgi:hypothetical protein